MTPFASQRIIRLCFALLCSTAIATVSHAQTDVESETAVSLTEAALRGPAIASVLEMPRETPTQKLQAVFTLLDLGEVDVAQSLWKEFSGEDLEEAAKADLVGKLGVARFLNLSRREDASGLVGSRDFAESCLRAAVTRKGDPASLTELLDALSDDSAEVRAAARSDLAVTGDVGATVCLEALAKAPQDKNSKRLRTELMLTLARMRPGVEPMLLAALADGRGQFRRDVVELAGYLHLQDAVPWLAAIAVGADGEPTVASAAYAALSKMGLSLPNVDEAGALIRGEIRQLEAAPVDVQSKANWWVWHHKTGPHRASGPGKLSSGQYPLSMIRKLSINRLASTLRSMGVSTIEDRQTELIYWLETAQLIEGAVGRRWDDISTEELSSTLAAGIERNMMAAAIVCAEVLGRRADVSALRSVDSRRSPLARALVHPNRELRYAALEAVMEIAPQQSFAGASGVSQALWYFAAGAGTPQAVAASSNISRASDWAGQLRGMGYDATPVTTGREALLTALSSPRLELILVDSDIGRPLVREVIFGLRSNPPLARVPVAVLSSLDNLSRAKQIAAQDPWLLATARPHGADAMEEVLARLTNLGGEPLTAERRAEQAQAALGWIAALLETGHPYDELLRDSKLVGRTFYNPDLTAASLRVLTVLGTADSQQLLVDTISAPALPIETRREAGDALAKSVQRFGKLLTSAEILRQYDRYNASETADRDTQEVLGKVLDILEK